MLACGHVDDYWMNSNSMCVAHSYSRQCLSVVHCLNTRNRPNSRPCTHIYAHGGHTQHTRGMHLSPQSSSRVPLVHCLETHGRPSSLT